MLIKKIIKKTGLHRPLKKINSIFFRGEVKKRMAAAKAGGTIAIPKTVIFEPTVRCNLDCQMCYQKKERMSRGKELSLKEIKTIFSGLKRDYGIKEVSLIGAEIFMRTDLTEMLNFFKSIGLRAYLATNGTLINETNVEELKKLKNISGIGYSLDGKRELHNRIRNRKYAFDRLLKAIALTKKDFSLTVNTVVMDENVDQLTEVGQLVEELGVPNYALQFEMWSSEKELADSQKLFGCQSSDFVVSVKENSAYDFDAKKIISILAELRKIRGLTVVIQPGLFEKYPDYYLQGNLRQKVALYCKDIDAVRINARGELIFCPFIKKSFGSLLENNLGDIWNGFDFRDFRARLLRANLSPICKRCCRLGNE